MDGRRFTGPAACASLAEKSNVTMPFSTVTMTASLIGRFITTPSPSRKPSADASRPDGSLAIAVRSPSAAALNGGKRFAQCLGAKPCAQLFHARGAHLGDGDL